jgi:hypothetical protein
MKTCTLLLTLAALLTSPLVKGSGVGWGSSPFDTQFLYSSTGSLLDDSFVFELGTFGSFVPTSSNIDQWQANWNLLDRAEAPAVSGWNSGAQYFTSSFTFETDGTVSGLSGSSIFTTGQQAYLWVQSGEEWALVTDNTVGSTANDIWQLPNPGDDLAQPLTWSLNTATTAIIGGVNGTQSTTGTHAFDPANNTLRLQTHVVPEPGTALLILVAGCLARLRRSARR